MPIASWKLGPDFLPIRTDLRKRDVAMRDIIPLESPAAACIIKHSCHDLSCLYVLQHCLGMSLPICIHVL
jgi:hypothetical protein